MNNSYTYHENRYSLYLGDVVEELSRFDDNTFDACFCDPPYLLEFMGKGFDKQHKKMKGGNDGQKMYQWHLRWCREVYRVLKPGGFILAFGGTRTIHRLTCAVEDVGFDVRDMIEYIYGQGFPKGHDLEKAIRKRAAQMAEHDLRFVSSTYLSSPVYACGQCRQVLLKVMQKHSASQQGKEGTESEATGEEQSSMERWSDLETPERELFRCQVCTMSHGILADGKKGSIYNGASSGDGEEVGKTTEENGSSSSHRPQPEQQSSGQFDAVSLERRAQTFRGYNPALKPAHEPLVLAMKPCNGTFAENAIEWEVAGLNIDGGRIGNTKDVPSSPAKDRDNIAKGRESGRTSNTDGFNPNIGRWPANLILSHHPNCQEIGTRRVRSGNSNRGVIHGTGQGSTYLSTKESGRHFADSEGLETVSNWDCHELCPVRLLDEQSGGNVSRFFYQAKVSTRERNLGGVDCRHPTLKPIDLCRYFATLLLPPPRDNSLRQLIVPFSGAGSEVAGALTAGWDKVIGIEFDPEYVEYSKHRVHASLSSLFRVQPSMSKLTKS